MTSLRLVPPSCSHRTHQDVRARAIRAVSGREAARGQALQLVVALAHPAFPPEHRLQPSLRGAEVVTAEAQGVTDQAGLPTGS